MPMPLVPFACVGAGLRGLRAGSARDRETRLRRIRERERERETCRTDPISVTPIPAVLFVMFACSCACACVRWPPLFTSRHSFVEPDFAVRSGCSPLAAGGQDSPWTATSGSVASERAVGTAPNSELCEADAGRIFGRPPMGPRPPPVPLVRPRAGRRPSRPAARTEREVVLRLQVEGRRRSSAGGQPVDGRALPHLLPHLLPGGPRLCAPSCLRLALSALSQEMGSSRGLSKEGSSGRTLLTLSVAFDWHRLSPKSALGRRWHDEHAALGADLGANCTVCCADSKYQIWRSRLPALFVWSRIVCSLAVASGCKEGCQ